SERQLSEYRNARDRRLADGDAKLGAKWQKDVHARAKADDPHAITLIHLLTDFAVRHDAPRDQPGDLTDQDSVAFRLDAHRRLLVLETGFVRRSVDELPLVVVNVLHRARHRIPVHVHVEDVHEDRDALSLRLHEGG